MSSDSEGEYDIFKENEIFKLTDQLIGCFDCYHLAKPNYRNLIKDLLDQTIGISKPREIVIKPL